MAMKVISIERKGNAVRCKVTSESDGRRNYVVVLKGRKRSCACGHWVHTIPRPTCKHIRTALAQVA
jgi:hypothetical protein